MTKLDTGTWIVVADSEKALLLRNLTDHADPHLELVARADQPAPPEDADRAGRRPDTGPGQMSAMEQSDIQALARDRFAGALSDRLFDHLRQGDFDRLVVVAAPQLLGRLRDELHKEVAARIVAEIPKTLTNHPLPALERLIKAELEPR